MYKWRSRAIYSIIYIYIYKCKSVIQAFRQKKKKKTANKRQPFEETGTSMTAARSKNEAPPSLPPSQRHQRRGDRMHTYGSPGYFISPRKKLRVAYLPASSPRNSATPQGSVFGPALFETGQTTTRSTRTVF